MEQLGLYCVPGVVFLEILLGAVPFSVFKEIIGYRNSGPHPSHPQINCLPTK